MVHEGWFAIDNGRVILVDRDGEPLEGLKPEKDSRGS
jgi:hypothetical protein